VSVVRARRKVDKKADLQVRLAGTDSPTFFRQALRDFSKKNPRLKRPAAGIEDGFNP
jgi:hypothetical protein